MQPWAAILQPTYAAQSPNVRIPGRISTQPKRSWITLIGSCLLMALGAALAFAIIVAAGSAALAGRQSSDGSQLASPATPEIAPGGLYQGVVTDSRCGARHLKNSHLSPAECARICVRQGASYVLVDGNRRYKLVGSEEALDKFAGQRIRVSGIRQGETIQVNSAASLF